MSDWEDQLRDFNKGFTDSPESRLAHNRLNQQMQIGRRAGSHNEQNGGKSPAGGGVWGGIVGLFGIAGGVAGLILGANFLDQGLIGVALMIGSAILGLIVAAAPLMLLGAAVRRLYEGHLWRRQGRDNTARSLVDYWHSKFGAEPLPELVRQIEDDGAAWIMDRKGNFILRMRNGSKLFVGNERDGDGQEHEVVRKAGGRGFDLDDARNMMLVHKSLGRRSIRLSDGTKKTKRLMWAAARLVDIDVDGYKPDRGALELLNELRGPPDMRAG